MPEDSIPQQKPPEQKSFALPEDSSAAPQVNKQRSIDEGDDYSEDQEQMQEESPNPSAAKPENVPTLEERRA